jgi:hypothetical protein
MFAQIAGAALSRGQYGQHATGEMITFWVNIRLAHRFVIGQLTEQLILRL